MVQGLYQKEGNIYNYIKWAFKFSTIKLSGNIEEGGLSIILCRLLNVPFKSLHNITYQTQCI
jgi:hypothetical protein